MNTLMLLSGHFEPTSDQRANCQRMLDDLEALFTDCAQLSPSDPDAFDTLQATAVHLASLERHYGPHHGFTLGQQNRLFGEARRVLPYGQALAFQPHTREEL